MAKYNFRILLETIEGRQFSYYSSSFVDTSVDTVLSSSQVYNRITGSVSASYQNTSLFSGSTILSSNDIDISKTFKDNVYLSASLSGSNNTGSIIFTALENEYDRLLRYKFADTSKTDDADVDAGLDAELGDDLSTAEEPTTEPAGDDTGLPATVDDL